MDTRRDVVGYHAFTQAVFKRFQRPEFWQPSLVSFLRHFDFGRAKRTFSGSKPSNFNHRHLSSRKKTFFTTSQTSTSRTATYTSRSYIDRLSNARLWRACTSEIVPLEQHFSLSALSHLDNQMIPVIYVKAQRRNTVWGGNTSDRFLSYVTSRMMSHHLYMTSSCAL